jgi:TonB family protein
LKTGIASLSIILLLSACAGGGSATRPVPPVTQDCSDYWVYRVKPVYPREAAKRRQEGWVLFQFDLDGSGSSKNVRIVDAEPEGVFEDNAVAAVSTMKFKPGVVQQGCTYPVQFRLAPASSAAARAPR